MSKMNNKDEVTFNAMKKYFKGLEEMISMMANGVNPMKEPSILSTNVKPELS